MNKKIIADYLSALKPFTNERDDIRFARQCCAKEQWDQITLEKIEFGIMLYHNKPSLLQGYINEIKENENESD